MYLDQLVNSSGTKLLTWSSLKILLEFKISRKKPKWYKKLKNIVLKNENTSTTMKEQYHTLGNKDLDNDANEIDFNDNRKKEWIIVWLPREKQYFVGQTIIKNHNTNKIIVQYYGMIPEFTLNKDISPSMKRH